MGDDDEVHIEIFTISGARLLSERITYVKGKDIPVNVDLPEGAYLLSIRNENMVFTEKLFVQHW